MLQIPELRCIDSPSGVQPNPYSAYGYPKDLKDISSGEDPTKLMELLRLVCIYIVINEIACITTN